MIYITCLAPYSFLFVVQRGFFALNDTKTPFMFTLMQIILVVLGSLACLWLPLEFIGFGLVAVFAVATMIQAVVGTWLYKRRVGSIDGRRITQSIVKFAVGSLLALAVGFLLLWGATSLWPEPSLLMSILLFTAISVLMSTIYLAALHAMKSHEVQDLLATVRARAGRGER